MDLLSDFILKNILRTGENNIVLQKENDTVEYKLDFDNSSKEAKAKYAKELAALCNYKGGYLIFGIDDSTNELIGLSDFVEPDNADLSNDINSYFSPAINFHSRIIEIEGRELFVIYVEGRESIPTVCIKGHQQELKEGTIYWRYSGQASPIRSGDLINLLNELKGMGNDRLADIEELRLKSQNLPLIQYQNGMSGQDNATIHLINNGERGVIKEVIVSAGDVIARCMPKTPQALNRGEKGRIVVQTKDRSVIKSVNYSLDLLVEDKIGTKYIIRGKFIGGSGLLKEPEEIK